MIILFKVRSQSNNFHLFIFILNYSVHLNNFLVILYFFIIFANKNLSFKLKCYFILLCYYNLFFIIIIINETQEIN